jgi:hypothetical protein
MRAISARTALSRAHVRGRTLGRAPFPRPAPDDRMCVRCDTMSRPHTSCVSEIYHNQSTSGMLEHGPKRCTRALRHTPHIAAHNYSHARALAGRTVGAAQSPSGCTCPEMSRALVGRALASRGGTKARLGPSKDGGHDRDNRLDRVVAERRHVEAGVLELEED